MPSGTSFANSFFARYQGTLNGTGTANSLLVLGAGGIDTVTDLSGHNVGSATAGSNLSIALAASQAWKYRHAAVGAYDMYVYAPVSRQAGATQNMTLNIGGMGQSGQDAEIYSTISDGGASGNLGVWADGPTNVLFATAQAYTGDTTVQRGTLSGTAGRVPSASRLVMGSGVLSLSGSASTTSVQTVASTNIRPGFGSVVLNPGTSGTVQLNLGAISRSAGGGIVQFGNSSTTLLGPSRIVTTSNTNTNGILGPWAITARQLTTDVGNQYVRVGAGGVLETLTYSGTSVINDLTDPTANYQLSAGGALTGNRTANTIYINSQAAATISLGANDLVLNGISRRVGSSGGAGYVNISSTGGRMVIGASDELVLAYGDFNITAPIVDGPTGAGRVVLGTQDYWQHGRGFWGNQHTFSGGLTYANATNNGGFLFGTADGSATASPFGTGTLTISGDPRYANLTGGGRIGTNNAQIWDVDFTITSSGTGLHMGTGPVSLGLGAGPSRNVGATGTVTVGGNVSDGTYASYPVTSLTKSGAGLLVLSGSLLYTGSTGVSAGTLLVSGTNPATMGPMSATGGVLQFARQASLYNADTTKYTAANLTTGSGAVLAVNVGGTGEFTSADLDIFKGLGTELTGFLPGSFLGIDTTNVSSGTFTYESTIANTNSNANALGIAKLGNGTLVLTGNNTMTGGVSVGGGTLLLTAANQIGTGPMTLVSGSLSTSSDAFMTSSPLTFAGGALRVTGTTLNSLSTGRTTTFTAATPVILDIADAANTFEVSQVLNQTTGNLLKLGPGTLVLTATNTYTGTTVLGSAGGPAGGTLRLSAAGRISGTSGTTAPLIYSGTLDTNGSSFAASLLTLGGGAAATSAGVTTGSGTLTLAGNVTFDATNNPGGATIAGNLSLANAARTFTVGNSTGADNDLTISAAITSGTLTKAGPGALLLSGTNTYAGVTTVSAGILVASSTAALPGWNTNGYTISAGGVLAMGSGFSNPDAATLIAGGTFAANSSVGFDTSGADRDYNTVIPNAGANARGLVKIGSGTLTLSAANTYTGTTAVGAPGNANAGTLLVASTGSISGIATVYGGTLDFAGNGRTLTALNLGGGAPGSAASVLTGSGTLTMNGNVSFDATNNANGATISGAMNILNAARTFTVGDSTAAAADLTVAAVISGTGTSAAVTKAGAGRLALTAANTYQGATTVQAGTLEFSSIGIIGVGASTLGNPVTATGTIAVGSTTTSAALRWVGTTSSTSNRVIDLAGTTGGATIEAAGSGALVLTATNTASGAGVKTLTLTGTSTADNAIGVIVDNTTTNKTSVVKDGSGVWRLTVSSSFSGGLTVRQGTVIADVNSGGQGQSGVFGAADAVTVGNATAGAVGTAALLLSPGVSVSKQVVVPASTGGTQTVLLGSTGTSGTPGVFEGDARIQLGRAATLVAVAGGTANFSNTWSNFDNTGTATANVAVGTAAYPGTVLLKNSLATTGAVNVQYGTLDVNVLGTLTAATGLSIDLPGTLVGSGVVAATLGGAGLVAPGNSPGILTAQGVDPTGGLDFNFEFMGPAPAYGTGTSSTNDVLRLTGSSAFTSVLTGSNVINVYLDVGTLSLGNSFRGGFFTDQAGNFLTSIKDASYTYWVSGTGAGQTTYQNKTYMPFSSQYSSFAMDVTTVSDAATFDGGTPVTGQVTTFTVGALVPEPGAMFLAALGLGLAGWTIGRRRRPL
ncbi:MAG: beta strand repeat-containing protein [Planctomycetota bacterium]